MQLEIASATNKACQIRALVGKDASRTLTFPAFPRHTLRSFPEFKSVATVRMPSKINAKRVRRTNQTKRSALSPPISKTWVSADSLPSLKTPLRYNRRNQTHHRRCRPRPASHPRHYFHILDKRWPHRSTQHRSVGTPCNRRLNNRPLRNFGCKSWAKDIGTS